MQQATEHEIPQLFFDLDGTLTDPKPGITRCIQHALAELDEPVPDTEALTWCIGPPLQQSFTTLVGERRCEEAVRLYRERFSEVGLYENSLYPGVVETLQALQQRGAILHVASSKPRIYVERILQHFELADHFQQVFGAELDGTRSDKTQLLAHALVQTACPAESAVMIGDRHHDAIGARNNQIEFIGVLYGYGQRDELADAGGSVFIHSPAELLELYSGTLSG